MGDAQDIRTKTRLVLEKRHQLIDLNKEYVNFEIFFECRSADATKDFEMLVINQEQLNTIDLTNLVMKKTRGGYISGNIVADEDKYQNYFLVIRALHDEPHDVDLEITLKPIQPNTDKMNAAASDPLPPPPPSLPAPPTEASCGGGDGFSKTHMYILIGVIVVIVIAIIGYMIYTRYYSSSATEKHGAVDHGDNVSDSGSSSSSSSKVSSVKKASIKSEDDEGGLLTSLIKKRKEKSKDT